MGYSLHTVVLCLYLCCLAQTIGSPVPTHEVDSSTEKSVISSTSKETDSRSKSNAKVNKTSDDIPVLLGSFVDFFVIEFSFSNNDTDGNSSIPEILTIIEEVDLSNITEINTTSEPETFSSTPSAENPLPRSNVRAKRDLYDSRPASTTTVPTTQGATSKGSKEEQKTTPTPTTEQRESTIGVSPETPDGSWFSGIKNWFHGETHEESTSSPGTSTPITPFVGQIVY